MNASQSLDCIGFYCPLPIVKTAERIKQLKIGEVLEIVADDEGVKKEIPAWCEAIGNEFLEMKEDGGVIKIYVKKTHD